MRYLLHQSQYKEIAGRRDFLYDIFHLYFLPRASEGKYIPLIPLGSTDLDLLFITGHINHVDNYLRTHIETISESTLVVTTCCSQILKKYTKRKQIYVPDIDVPFCYYHDGTPYGFQFNLSDSELNFYNAIGDITTRLKNGYRLLN